MRKSFLTGYAYIIGFFCVVLLFTMMYYAETQNISGTDSTEQESASSDALSDTNHDDEDIPAANDEDVTAINYEDISFIIKSVDGDIIVYYDDGETVFFDTGMSVSDFGYPDVDIPEEGIVVDSAEELFNLLESYSS